MLREVTCPGTSSRRSRARGGPAVASAALVCALFTAFVGAELQPRDRPYIAAPQLRRGAVKALAEGKLLVAARGLPDPNFSETVVLLAQFGPEGAMGLILNRRTSVPLSRVFPKLTPRTGDASVLFVGGPVAADSVLALVRSTRAPKDSKPVVDDVHVVASRESLESQLSANADPSRVRVYLGYSGWGPGQLERETLLGSWHVVRAERGVVFDPDPAGLWEREIEKTGGLLASSGYPSRSTSTGSIRAARQAGRNAASVPTAAISAMAAASVAPSRGSRP
jgi:putative transcriptional regulator